MKIQGCITAMVTPFTKSGEVDYEGLKSNVRFQIESGVSGVVPLGTTGESPTITEEERRKIIKTVVEEADGKVLVIAGTGTNSTARTVKATKEAKELGADAALIVSPYYNKPTQEGLYLHFREAAEKGGLPIVVYNIQGRTGVNIETSTMLRLSKVPGIIAVKEASGNINQMMDVIQQLPKTFSVVSGDDSMTLPLMSLGGNGIISVVSNLVPREVSRMCSYGLQGDFEKAREMHYSLLPIFRAAFIETNPIPIKAAMGMAGLPAGPCRLPLCSMSQQNEEKLRAVLDSMGLLKKVAKARV